MTIVITVCAASSVTCIVVLLAARKILTRIHDAVDHLEQHADELPSTNRDDEATELRHANVDRNRFFAPPAGKEHR